MNNKLVAKLAVAFAVLGVTAGQADAALAEALETALTTGAGSITTNITEVAAIGIPVLIGVLVIAGVWKIAKLCFR